jgi:hypothetical protein
MTKEHWMTAFAALAMGIASFSLIWMFNSNAELKSLKQSLDDWKEEGARKDVSNLQKSFDEWKVKHDADTKEWEAEFDDWTMNNGEDLEDLEKEQKAKNKRDMKLDVWTKDQITFLRQKHDLPLEPWPDLE